MRMLMVLSVGACVGMARADGSALDVLDRLRGLAGGEWIHEATRPDGSSFRVRNVIEPGPDGHSLLTRGWLGGDGGMVYHSLTQIWQVPGGDPDAGSDSAGVRFQNLNEQGAVATGEIRLVGPDTLLWDWHTTAQDGTRTHYLVYTELQGHDRYRMTMFEAGAETPLVEATFERRHTGDADIESYAAHIAAAESSLRLGDAGAARDFLARAPAAHRGWEWSYLQAAADASVDRWPAEQPVFRLAWSVDGTRLVTVHPDGGAVVRDAADGRTLIVLEGHEGEVFAAAFSPDGRHVATGSRDGTVRVWDAATGRELARPWSHDRPISCVAYSADGSVLAASSYAMDKGPRSIVGTVRVLDAVTGEERARLQGGNKPLSMIAFSPDGSSIAAASWASAIYVWDVASEVLRHELTVESERYAALDCVAFSPDGSRVAAAGKDWAVRVWDAGTGAPEMTLHGHGGWVNAVEFAPDGRSLASGSHDGTARLWDAITGEELAVLHGHRGAVTALGFAPDGRRLATGSADKTIRMWSAEPGLYGRQLLRHEPVAYAVACSRDGRWLASGGELHVRLWHLRSGRLETDLVGHNDVVVDVAFAPDGRLVASASHDRTVRLWDVASGTERATLFPRTDTVDSVGFTADGRIVVSAGAGELRAFETTTGERVKLPRTEARAVVLGPSGLLAWRAGSGSTELFSARSGDLRVRLDGEVLALEVSPDGALLATGATDGTVVIWDGRSGTVVHTLAGHREQVRALHFSPDGRRLASASRDNTVAIWDVDSGMRVATLRGFREWVYDLRFTPDGDRLVACPLDGTIVVAHAVPLAERLERRPR